jgi:LacI family transcriptional regulator
MEERFPFVAFGRTEGDDDFPFVDEDGRTGIAEAAQHLIDRGHRRIAFIAADDNLMFARDRQQGYVDTMQKNGLPEDKRLIVQGDLGLRSGRLATRDLLDLAEPPTAIMAANDLMALGAMAAIQARGLDVGRDISVTGFDDIPLAENAHPPLTTVRQPIYRIGELVCDMLIRVIRGEPMEHRRMVLRPTLVVRESSMPAAIPVEISGSSSHRRR